jgi:hypothetical protein
MRSVMRPSLGARAKAFVCWRSALQFGTALAAPIALMLLLATNAALADCTQPPGSTVVTCAPPGTNGFDAGAQNGLSLTVQSGATVSIPAFGTGILLNDTNSVINSGTISSTHRTRLAIERPKPARV